MQPLRFIRSRFSAKPPFCADMPGVPGALGFSSSSGLSSGSTVRGASSAPHARLRSLAILVQLCAALLLSCPAAGEPAEAIAHGSLQRATLQAEQRGEAPLIRIGSTDMSLSHAERRAIAETFLYLSRQLPNYRIEVRSYPVAELELAVKNGELDIFLASSGFYRRVYHRGLRDLVTMTTREAPDPNFGSGSVFIVRQDSPIRTVADMKGRRAVVSWREGFTGFFIPLAEILHQGYDPDSFFSDYVHGGSPMRRLLETVDAGLGDVAFARACTWEELQAEDPAFAQRFRLVGVKSDPKMPLRCAYSTGLFPNWTIVSTSRAPWWVSRDVTAALLSMPATSDGFSWAVVSDFASVDELYRDLKRGPYEYLRVRSVSDFARRYWPAFVAAALLVAALMLHSWRCRILIRKRTEELNAVMAKEREAVASAREAERQKELLEQVSVVGAMSSLITHELNAPLNAITSSCRSLERYFENEPPPPPAARALALIARQCDKASEIVQHVRAYVKRREIVRQPVDLTRIAAAVRRDLSIKHPAVRLEASLPLDPVVAAGDPLEIELLLNNLVKNAVEAVAGTPEPAVLIRLKAENGRAVIEVEDNAADTKPEDVRYFATTPLASSKKSGLGLGLLIVRTIVERSSGSLSARWADPGLCVEVTLALFKPAEAPAED